MSIIECGYCGLEPEISCPECGHDAYLAGKGHIEKIVLLESEIASLRASQADAGAVMVEAAVQWCEDEADSCDDAAKWGGHRKYVQDCKAAAYELRNAASKIRVLSTLSPIAAAARVLLADPDAFDGFKGYILNRNEMGVSMSGYAEGAMDYLRALAEQEKAE